MGSLCSSSDNGGETELFFPACIPVIPLFAIKIKGYYCCQREEEGRTIQGQTPAERLHSVEIIANIDHIVDLLRVKLVNFGTLKISKEQENQNPISN